MTFPKVCGCGLHFSRAQWDALPEVGTQRFDWGEVQKLKNCTCGSTLAEVIEPGEQQNPEVGDVWKAKDGRMRIKITEVDRRGVSYRGVRGKTRGFASLADFFGAFTPVRRGA